MESEHLATLKIIDPARFGSSVFKCMTYKLWWQLPLSQHALRLSSISEVCKQRKTTYRCIGYTKSKTDCGLSFPFFMHHRHPITKHFSSTSSGIVIVHYCIIANINTLSFLVTNV